MKIGVSTIDGKRYQLLREFNSVEDAVQIIKETNRIANAQNPVEIACINDYYIALNACLLTPQEARDIIKSYSSFLNTEDMHADLRKLAKDLHTLTRDVLPERLRKLGIEVDG